MDIYSEIKKGLEEAIEYEKGNLKLKTEKLLTSENDEKRILSERKK